MTRVVVVGGGISGLAAARVLAGAPAASQDAGPASSRCSPPPRSADEVILLETAPLLGGKLLTGRIAGIPVELGPDQFLRRDPSAEHLVDLLGLGPNLVAPAARAAGVYSRRRLCALPAGLMLGVPTDAASLEESGILSEAGLAAFTRLSGPSARPPAVTAAQAGLEEGGELSAGAILRPLVGDEVVDRLVDPLLGGINAGSVDGLSLGTVAPQIARLLADRPDGLAALTDAFVTASAASRPSPFFGLCGGLSRLVEAVRQQLVGELGVRIIAGFGVATIERRDSGDGYAVSLDAGAGDPIEADGIVLAVPGPAAGRILEDLVPEAAFRLAAVPYASVALATMAFRPGSVRAAGIPPDWSGVLVPRVEGAMMTAVSFLSAKWPWTTEAGTGRADVVRVSAGRYLDDRIATTDDRGLVRHLRTELSELVGITAEPSEIHLERWDGSFPQYLPGHGSVMAEVSRAISRHPGLGLAGAVLGGVGIPACISSGERAAQEVVAGLAK